jgi:hypothetical protein
MSTEENKKNLDLLKELAEQLEKNKRSRKEEIDSLEEQIALAEELKGLGDSLIGIDIERLEVEKEYLMLKAEEDRLAKIRAEGREQEYQDGIRKLAQDRTALGIREDSTSAADNLLKITLGVSDASKLMGERLMNPTAAFAGMMGSLKKLNVQAMVGAIAQNSLELAVAQDRAVVSFRAATGASGELDDNIRGLERSTLEAGVTADDAAETIQNLFVNVTDFTMMSQRQQEILGETVAVLDKLGVSAANSTKNIQFAIKTLGMSTGQAEKLQRELFTFAQELGVSADQIAEDFGQLGPQIAALGNEGVGAFKELAAQAKSTGIVINDLIQITDQFNKFDTAAQAVGRLNALLGGPFLNTLELVNETNPARRMEMLKGALDDAAVSFDNMDFYQRKALASAMGLNVEQLALLSRGSLDKIMPTPKSAAEIEELAAQTAQFNTIMEELGQIAKSLAISFGPLIGFLKDFLQFIQPAIPYITAAGIALAIMTLPLSGTAIAISAVVAGLLALTSAFHDFNIGTFVGFSPSTMDSLTSLRQGFADLKDEAADTPELFTKITTEQSMMSTSATAAAAAIDRTNVATAAAQTAAPAATAPAAAPTGPPPVINVNLSIDGQQFATVVNSVEVSKYSSAQSSTMYNSIISMIEQGLVKG